MSTIPEYITDSFSGDLRPALRVAISTLGCRLNQFESEKMVAELVARGFQRVDETAEAELYIVNTCTVTHRADSDSRQLVRRAIRNHPDSAVVVAGCFVDKDPSEEAESLGASAIIRNSEKDQVVDHLRVRLAGRHPNLSLALNHLPSRPIEPPTFVGHSRAWLKVSDGCNQWCSFCILPTVRGRLKNRSPQEILEDLQGLIDRGYREIVLTGINVGHYSWRQGTPELRNLAELIRLFMKETSDVRFRLSSIEPQTVRQELRTLYAEADERLCRHWHLPLQSGSARVLKLMQRPYQPSYYLQLAEQLKLSRAGTTIGADVIVGFPGETEADFAATKSFCESGVLDYLHIFSYSDRSGTPASKMTEKIRPEIIRERNQILTELSSTLKSSVLTRSIGSLLRVIAEGVPTDGARFGTSDNFLRVQFKHGGKFRHEVVPMRITGATDEYLLGEIEDQTKFEYRSPNLSTLESNPAIQA